MAAHTLPDDAFQRSRDAALAAMRLAMALTAAIVFPTFDAAGMGDGPFGLRLLLVASGLYGLVGLSCWLLIARSHIASARLRFPMLLADAAFAAAILSLAGEPGIVIYAPALLSVQSARERFGLNFGRVAAFVMSLAFAAGLSGADEWSGQPLAIIALMAGFWMMMMPGYGRVVRPVEADASPPPVPASSLSEPRPLPSPPAPARPGASASRVLVAQSNRPGRLLLEKCLARAGYEFAGAAHSDEVLRLLGDADERPFDLLMVDMDLPGMGGEKLAQLVRSTDFGPAPLAIVGLDSSGRRPAPDHLRAIGMNDCLSRPVHPGKLLDCLHSLLSAKSPQAQAAPAAEEPLQPAEEAEADKFAQILDLRALRDLENLGGRDFVRDIANQFVADGALALRSLAHSMQKGDASLFRDQAHALRSSAANVGARGIYVTCLAWREIEAEDLSRNGHAYLQALHDQFEEATRLLLQYLEGPAADSGPALPDVPERAA